MSGEEDVEYGFEASAETGIAGLMYVTRNPLLADTLRAARPDQPMYVRPAITWTEAQS